MSGQQSAGFDLVMEFSETPLQDLLGVAFDTSDFLCGLIDLLNIPCQGFNVSVSLDRPTDVVLSASQTDAVDIQSAAPSVCRGGSDSSSASTSTAAGLVSTLPG
jgi:hypothetical protein